MAQERFLHMLNEAGVLKDGHYILTSGRHATQSIQCAKLFEHATLTSEICSYLAERFVSERIDLVVGPAIGGIIPAYELSRILAARNSFCERDNGGMSLRRGFYIHRGERVLIAEDVITTGGSVNATLRLIEQLGGVPAGVCAIADLSGGKTELKIPSIAAVHLELTSYPADECPLCQKGIPIEHRASRSI